MNSSSSLSFEDRSVIETLQNIQNQFTYTILIFFLLIGNIGCVFNTIIFLRPCLISSSCSRYFLSSSFANVFQLNIGLVSHILDFGFHIHPYHHSIILCKLRNYLINVAGFLSQTYLLLACIDRYLISLNRSSSRRINTVAVANRIIWAVTVFWMVILSHMLVYGTILQPSQFCFFSTPSYVFFISVHNLILSGFVLPILMVLFGLLTLKNIRLIRRQACVRRRKRRNHYLSLMLISNVFVSVFFTLLYTSGLIYLSFFMATSSKKISYRDSVEQRFVSFIAIMFYYAPFAIFFYVNIFTSQRFRSELKSILCSERSSTVVIREV
jgi:hypothetical protein